MKEYMLIFTVSEKQKFEEGKKTCVKDLVYFMLTLDLPKEGARISKLRTFTEPDLKMTSTGSVSLSSWNNKANAGLRADSKKEKSMTSEQPPTARAPGGAEKALAFGQAPACMHTNTHTQSFHTMTRYKECREMALQAKDSPLLVTLPSSSQLLLAAGLGNDSGRQAVGRS